ncbi:ABC transporter [Comamonas serinivorans]|uniref:Transport permease protein n=1 Tax=Comamonas serinivorans TaxID=1082851 RepID=A0A1Y0ESE3_9BURK|nr:ABC transporter permease [Comamonas serinivorans]ARU06291.1 ABC transporter [Comamonas serinivorans]
MKFSVFDDLRTLWRLRGLLTVLTRREIAARFAGSAGGMLWAWVQPLLSIAAYYLVFDVVFAMRMGENAPTDRVGTFLIVGMLAWMAFSEAVQRGMGSLVEAGGILQKNPLPPALFPTRAVLASALVYAPLMLALVLAYWPKHQGAWAVLAMLPLVLLQVVLAWLLGYLLAILMAALRDVQQIVAFVFSIGVFAAPILFPLTLFPERWRWLLWLNPMTAWVLGYQAVLLQGQWPSPSVWLAMAVWLVVAAVLLNLALRRSRDQLVDWL